MNVFLNENGQVDFTEVNAAATVQELLDAIDVFLGEHPVNCDKCKGDCCKKMVSVDNVFVKRNSRGNLLRFVGQKLDLKDNQFFIRKKFACKFLNGLNKCDIYKARPLTCRLYMCFPYSDKYELLEGLLAAVFGLALVYEVAEAQINDIKELENQVIATNPVLRAESYDLPLRNVVSWGENVLKAEEDVVYKKLCSMFELD